MKSRTLCFLLFVWTMLVLALPLSAQNPNIVVNGDFEEGNTHFNTQYGYRPGIVEEGCYCIDGTASGHAGGLGWVQPGSGTIPTTGQFMLVNGVGGNNAPSTVVWKQTLNVTSGTQYTFSFKYATLSNNYGYGNPGIIKAVLKRNGEVLREYSQINLNQTDHTWHQYPNSNWQSGDVYGPVTLEFYDMYTGNPDYGDDFALDNISFVPNVYYSALAHTDETMACLNQYIDIDVLANDEVTPNTNDATVTMVNPPTYGTWEVRPNKKIRYTYTGGNTTDQFKYRVTIHGAYSEAWVNINTNQSPVVANIQAPDDPICMGYPLNIPTPSVTPNVTGSWEFSSGPNGPWNTLSNPNSIGLELNNHYVRYTASNDCGPGSSNAVQIYVSSAPTIPAVSAPAPICEGPNVIFDLPTVVPSCSGYNSITGQGWLIANTQNGPFVEPFSNTNITYNNHNGRYICYYAENDCGGPIYSPPVLLTVNAVPIVPNINAPSGICEGLTLDLTSLIPNNIVWRHNDPATCGGYWQIYHNDGTLEVLPNNSNSIPSISYDEYNGCSIQYVPYNGCGAGNPSNAVPITVYSAQDTFVEYTACDTYTWINGVVCDHTDYYSTQTQNENGCDITAILHFTLSDAFDTTFVEESCNSYYWSKTNRTYYETSVYDTTIYYDNPEICDSTYRLDLTINHAPVFTEQLESPNPIEVCSSYGVLNVSAPLFENGGTPHWEYSTSENGPWISDFDPSAFNLNYGSYWLRCAVVNGCTDEPVTSNPVPFYISEPPVISIVSGQMPDSICAGDVLDLPVVTVDFRNKDQVGIGQQWQMAVSQEGPYGEYPVIPISNDCWIQYIAQNSCGTDTLGPVHVSVINVEDITKDHSGCDMVEFDGVQYTTDTVIDVLMYEPCPYTIQHNIIVNHSEYTMEPIPQSTCYDVFVWHGQTYYRIDGLEQLMHFDTVTEHGCSKILEQYLNFTDYNSKNESRVGCDSYTWSRNDSTYYYDESQPVIFDSVVYHYEDACDSVIYLDLTLGREYEVEGNPILPLCYGEEWHGISFYNDTIVYDSLKTVVTQCDSIIRYNLTIIQPFDTIVELENCKPYWWNCQGQGNLFDEDGEEFTATLTSQITGCDSIVTIRFSLLPKIELPVEDVLVCEPFVLPDGGIVDHSDLWSYTIPSLDACDTIVSLNVTFTQMDTLTKYVSACNEYPFHGQTYHVGTWLIPYDTLYYTNGCDSIVHCLNLTVVETEQLGTITGNSSVYVATNLISGIYRYTIDTTGIIGSVTWSLDNPDWIVLDYDDVSCQILVTTPGTANLIANFHVEVCDEMEKRFAIHAGFYDVDENNAVNVSIYPNPTDGMVTVEAQSIESVRVMDMMGQTLEMRVCDLSDTVKLNMGGYAPSVYLFEVTTVNGSVRRRVVVCR